MLVFGVIYWMVAISKGLSYFTTQISKKQTALLIWDLSLTPCSSFQHLTISYAIGTRLIRLLQMLKPFSCCHFCNFWLTTELLSQKSELNWINLSTQKKIDLWPCKLWLNAKNCEYLCSYVQFSNLWKSHELEINSSQYKADLLLNSLTKIFYILIFKFLEVNSKIRLLIRAFIEKNISERSFIILSI